MTAGGTLKLGGAITIGTGSGTFTPGAGTVEFTAGNTLPASVFTTFNNLTINGGTTTMGRNVSVTGNLAILAGSLDLSTFTANRSAAGGTLTVANGASLLLGGSNFPTNYTTYSIGSTSTVNYDNAGAQTVSAQAYGNLIFSGSGAKSMVTGTSVGGNLSIAPTGTATASVGTGLTLSVGSLTLGGNPVVSGTWGSTTATTAANHNNTYFAATTGKLDVATGAAATRLIVTLPGQTFTSGTGNSGTVSGQTAGTSFNITLTAVDAINGIDTAYSGSKTVSYAGPSNAVSGGATPTYTITVTFTAGQATSVATTLVKAETPTITASITGLTGVASSSLTVAAGSASKLAFTTQPGGGTGGTVWTTQPVVTVQDPYGNTVSNSASIALAITSGTPTSGGPGTVGGTSTKSASSGGGG